MRARTVLAGIVIAVAAAAAPAQSQLRLEVFTSTPEGYSTTSTLVYGAKEDIIIDPQFLLSEAHKVAAMVLESGRMLTTVYSTHAHPDHYFGLAVMKPSFPNARLVALPAVVTGIRNGWEGRYKFWTGTYGNNIPAPPPIVPEELTTTTLTLEGHELQIVGGVQGDGPNNSFVWIPSLKAVIAGDIVFSGVHFGVPTGENRALWLKTLEQIAALKPAIVIPGHQVRGAANDLTALDFMRKYMQDWDAAVAASKTPDELVARMKKLYPNLGMEQLLTNGAAAAFKAAAR